MPQHPISPGRSIRRSGTQRGARVLSAVVALVVVFGTLGSTAGSSPAEAQVTPSPTESSATEPTATATPESSESAAATRATRATETPGATEAAVEPEPSPAAPTIATAPAPAAPTSTPGASNTPAPTPGPKASSDAPAPSEELAPDQPEAVTAEPTPSPDPDATPEPTETADEDVPADEPLSMFARAPPGDPGEADAFGSFADVGIAAIGVPEGPRQIWTESFEQGLTNAASSITAYATNRYTASTGWAIGTNCTGVLLNYLAPYPNPQFCPTQLVVGSSAAREARRMADVLGQVQAGVAGGTATGSPVNQSTSPTQSATPTQSNHALVSLPYAAIPAGSTTVLQSAAGIGVTAPDSRYYALRMDTAGARCGTNNASLQLNLVTSAATPTTLLAGFAAPVIPCAATGNVYYTSPALAVVPGITDGLLSPSARAATSNGTNTALLTPGQISTARVQITNSQLGAGGGFGIDNLQVLDVTPALDVTFDEVATATVPTTLTYTITNTSDLLAKTDWGFTAALPQGLRVATTPAIAGTCVNATGTAFAVTAVAGSGGIAATGGDLTASAASCTITVDVLAATAGTYSSGPVTPVGLVASPPASLTVEPPTTITILKNLPTRTAPADQFILSLRQGQTVLATATTTGTATGLQAARITRAVVQPGSTYTISETPTGGAGIGYSNSYECTRAGTVIASGSGGSGVLTVPSEVGAEVICTFTNTAQTQRLFCDTNHFYSITTGGELQQGDILAGGAPATIGTWSGVDGANALGIGSGGDVAYAIDLSPDSTDVTSILKWTSTGGFSRIANTAYTTVIGNGTEIPNTIVAGAFDSKSGRYFFGKFANQQFHIWSFTDTPNAPRFAYVGVLPTGNTPNGNGDMAFDNDGNLYVVGASTVNNASSASIYTVTAEVLAAGGALTVNSSTVKPLIGLDGSFADFKGIAFSPRGTIYLADFGSAYEFNATTWTRVSGTPRIPITSIDLASCSSPSTVTVQKNIVGRASTSDQFTLAASVPSQPPFATATTSGGASGRQTAQIGPFPTASGTTVTISETMAAGSLSAISGYRASYECYSNGVRLSQGSAPTGTVTTPNGLSANVNCTFFNAPLTVAPASVQVTKTLRESTGVTRPGVDWTVGTTATATFGTATALPNGVPTQQTDGAGQATWQVLFGTGTSRATVVVSEVQQAGFAFVSGSCTVNGTAVTTTFAPVNAPAGQPISATLTGIAPGAAVACAIVNRSTASLTLVKQVSSGSAAPTDWTLSATGPAASTGALPGPSGRSGTAAVTGVPVSPGVTYRLAEIGGSLTYVQTGPWQCRTATGTTVAVTAAGDITPTTGATITCTVTNATASVTLLKQVITPQAGFRAPDWRVTATPAVLAGGTLPTESRLGAEYLPSGNPDSTFNVRPGHGYTLSEAVTDPTRPLAYRELRLERLDGSTWTTVPTRTISALAGERAVYRFVNAPVEPTRLPLTGGTSADAFYIGGGSLFVLAFALLVWNRRQRMRGAFR